MSPFEPVGETARWRIVYGLLQPLATGATLTYEPVSYTHLTLPTSDLV